MEENKRKTLAVTHKSSTEWFFSLSIKKGTQKNDKLTVAMWHHWLHAINLPLFSIWHKQILCLIYTEQEGGCFCSVVSSRAKSSPSFLVLTFLMEPRGKLLSLLKVWAGKHFQHLFDAAPPRPCQDLSQSDAKRRIATVHIWDVVGILKEQKNSQTSALAFSWV